MDKSAPLAKQLEIRAAAIEAAAYLFTAQYYIQSVHFFAVLHPLKCFLHLHHAQTSVDSHSPYMIGVMHITTGIREAIRRLVT
jgi:hypothetical protein